MAEERGAADQRRLRCGGVEDGHARQGRNDFGPHRRFDLHEPGLDGVGVQPRRRRLRGPRLDQRDRSTSEQYGPGRAGHSPPPSRKFFTRADRIADETGDALLKAWSRTTSTWTGVNTATCRQPRTSSSDPWRWPTSIGVTRPQAGRTTRWRSWRTTRGTPVRSGSTTKLLNGTALPAGWSLFHVAIFREDTRTDRRCGGPRNRPRRGRSPGPDACQHCGLRPYPVARCSKSQL